jgi:hypothetical protein
VSSAWTSSGELGGRREPPSSLLGGPPLADTVFACGQSELLAGLWPRRAGRCGVPHLGEESVLQVVWRVESSPAAIVLFVATAGRSRGDWPGGDEMAATTPRAISWRASSAQLQRDCGTPVVAGNSQANCLTSTTAQGGKDPWSPGAVVTFQARQASIEKPFPPPMNHLGAGCPSHRAAISVLDSPSAAIKTILARTTRWYGSVYARARLPIRGAAPGSLDHKRALARHASLRAG